MRRTFRTRHISYDTRNTKYPGRGDIVRYVLRVYRGIFPAHLPRCIAAYFRSTDLSTVQTSSLFYSLLLRGTKLRASSSGISSKFVRSVIKTWGGTDSLCSSTSNYWKFFHSSLDAKKIFEPRIYLSIIILESAFFLTLSYYVINPFAVV